MAYRNGNFDRNEFSVPAILFLRETESSSDSRLPFVTTSIAERHLSSRNSALTSGSHMFSILSNDSGLVASKSTIAVSTTVKRAFNISRYCSQAIKEKLYPLGLLARVLYTKRVEDGYAL